MSKNEEHLANDPDIAAEREALASIHLDKESVRAVQPSSRSISQPFRFIPLKMSGNSFQGSSETAELLAEVGGSPAIQRMTRLFYEKAFANPHFDLFIVNHDDPHFMRLANWIVEKMGGEGKPWTRERAERSECPVRLADGRMHVVYDRTSAHVAAWFSAKRPADVVGQRFQLHDSRVWMRLMFWSAREAGLFTSPTFEDWYIRFIGHFISIYEASAPLFARESARWSEKTSNIEAYHAAGNTMVDVMGRDGQGVTLQQAIKCLPRSEASDALWPYVKKP